MRGLALLLAFALLLLVLRCTRDDAEHAAWSARVDQIEADVDEGRE